MSDVRLLCVDPDESARREMAETLRANLDGMDPEVETADSIDGAEQALTDRPVDCVVTEYDLPEGTGLDLADRTRSLVPDASVILFTEASPEEMETAHLGATVMDYLNRGVPDPFERLAGLVQMTVALRSQISYPLPPNEDERLAALGDYDLDADGLEESLGRVADLALEHFDAGSAAVNTVEARSQRYLAASGFDLAPGETVPRERSVCTFTILEDDGVMAVEDVREDPRFAPDSETLESAGIRSYLGASIRTPSGLPIGTVCVADDRPRSFDGPDREYLSALAGVAMDLLEARGGPGGPATPGEDPAETDAPRAGTGE